MDLPGAPDLDRPRTRVGVVASLAMVVFPLIFLPINVARGLTAGVVADVVLAIVFAGNAWLAWRRPGAHAVVLVPSVALLAFVVSLAPTGAIQAWVWAYAIPPVVFVLGGLRRGGWLNGLLMVGLGAALWRWPPTHVLAGTPFSLACSYALVLGVAWLTQREQARLTEELVRLTTVDHLTGVGNSRSFEQALNAEIARFLRYHRPFSVLVFDLDHFKDINDQFGHPVGDAVLVAVARAARVTMRDTDHVARLGGDEFAVLLPESDLTRADGVGEQLADRLRAAVRDAAREITRLSAAEIAISIGVTSFGPADTPTTVLARADAAHYETKHRGRNGVTVLPAGAPLRPSGSTGRSD